MILTIDLNSDLGEGFGTFESINDKGIMKYISSANIACGFHAGDHQTMHETVLEAKRNQVSIGAHPGLNDLYGFGRRMIPVSPREVYDLMIYQLGAINAFACLGSSGGEVRADATGGAVAAGRTRGAPALRYRGGAAPGGRTGTAG